MFGRAPFVENISRVATAAATYVIQAPQLNAGDVLVIEAVGVTNEDTAAKSVTWGFRNGLKDVWVHTITCTTAALWYSWVGPITIPSDSRLIFKVVSPAAGDRTNINVVGYFLEC